MYIFFSFDGDCTLNKTIMEFVKIIGFIFREYMAFVYNKCKQKNWCFICLPYLLSYTGSVERLGLKMQY